MCSLLRREEGEFIMPRHDLETSRHKPPRQECIDAGWDFPHEGDGLQVLAGEWDCPPCRLRAMEKRLTHIQIDLLKEQRRANDLKERELQLREVGEWVEPKPAFQPRYNILPPKPTGIGKGGVRID